MPNIISCIDDVLEEKLISKEVAEAIKASHDPIAEINLMLENAKVAKRQAAIDAVRVADAWDNIRSYGSKPKDLETGLMNLFVKGAGKDAGYENIEAAQRYYRSKYHAIFADGLNKFRTRKLGLSQNEDFLNDFVRVRHGQKPLNSEWAEELNVISKSYDEMLDSSLSDFNALGGHIAKNKRYNLPNPTHDAETILARGNPDKADMSKVDARQGAKDYWINKVKAWIDTSMMPNDLGKPLEGDELDAALDYAFESITRNGANKTDDFSPPGHGKKMGNRNAEQRFLYFKDAESWLAYQNEFGRGDVFQTMISNVEAMANDAGTMKVMGTNPQQTFEILESMVDDTLHKAGEKISGTKKNMRKAVFETVAGYVDKGHMTGLADFMQATRNVITASKLGAATLSAFSDEGFTALTAAYNGLNIGKIWSKKAMLMTDEEMQTFAVKVGLGAEAWTATASAGARFGDFYQVGNTGKMAEVVIRGSGLQAFTDAGRKAFSMEFAGLMAENFGKSLDELDPKLKAAFTEYGIDNSDWDLFRMQRKGEEDAALSFKGVKYANMLADGSEKFHRMVMSEVDYAVPTPDARVRAITTGGMDRATAKGQIVRSLMNLKSFPITMVSTHMMRVAYGQRMNRAAYFGAMMAATTLFGVIAMQAKDMAAGREPRPMGEMDSDHFKKFWIAAAAQGGGLGIFGDFLFSDHNRFGGGLAATAFGPTGSMLDDTLKLTFGNAIQLGSGDDMNLFSESLKYIEDNSPGVWYVQPAINAMFDQLELMGDPKAAKKHAKARKKRKQDFKQDYWWGPGEALPDALQ